MRTTIGILLVSAVVLCGCSVDYKAEVVSDTYWWGYFGDWEIEGEGCMVIDIEDEHPQCCVVYKETVEGFLQVRIVAEGGGVFNPGHTGWTMTTASYGAVAVCSKGCSDCGCDVCCCE